VRFTLHLCGIWLILCSFRRFTHLCFSVWLTLHALHLILSIKRWCVSEMTLSQLHHVSKAFKRCSTKFMYLRAKHPLIPSNSMACTCTIHTNGQSTCKWVPPNIARNGIPWRNGQSTPNCRLPKFHLGRAAVWAIPDYDFQGKDFLDKGTTEPIYNPSDGAMMGVAAWWYGVSPSVA